MIILGTNSIKDTGFNVANSVRFNAADSPSLKIAIGSGATNTKKFTFSGWFKKCTNVTGGGATGAAQTIFDINGTNTGSYFNDDHDQFTMNLRNTGSVNYIFKTNRQFRDNSAWLHIVVAIDTTQATEGNRVTIYFNGVEETSLAEENYPPQDYEAGFNGGTVADFYIGAVGTTKEFNGYMAEVVCIDGTKYAASDFGEFDEDSPSIWKPKDVSGLTFGNKGFYLDFKDSANLGNDANGGTDLTEANLAATDQSTDTCTNNAIVLNNLAKGANVTLTEGNLQFTSNNRYGTVGTFGLSSGKWYWEVKVVDAGSDIQVGIFQDGGNIGYPNAELGKTSQGWSVISIGGNRLHSLSQSSYGGAAFSDGDILMVALDMDNGKWYMGKNNSWFDSGNPATSSSPAHTGITGTIFPSIATYAESESGSINYQFNFGSPPYAISSSNADGNGYGNFEYAVPSGYYALNTKNLAEYG